MKSNKELLEEQKINELKARENLWNILYEVSSEFRINLRQVRELQYLNNEALQSAMKQIEQLQQYILATKDDK